MLQLKKFLDIPVSTREEAREYRKNPEGWKINVGKDVEKLDSSYIADESVKWSSHRGKQSGSCSKS